MWIDSLYNYTAKHTYKKFMKQTTNSSWDSIGLQGRPKAV